MSDIALEAGVSRSTVSLVLNNKHSEVGIPESTRHRVLNAAHRLGYRPNEMARAMVTGKNRSLVYLLHDPSQEVTSRILKGALIEAEHHGYLIKLVGREDVFGERDIQRCVELRPTGVMALYASADVSGYLKEEMDRYRIPVVLLDSSSFPLPGVARVLSDDIQGVALGIEHLHSLGHRRIAYISGARSSATAGLREEGYRKAMASLGLSIPEGYVTHGDWGMATTQAVTEQLLRHEIRPTALFCADDKMALVASRTADRLGIRVPEDLSIVGFADLEMARFGNPPLTTIAQPFVEIGKAAVRSLLEASLRLERHEELETAEILIPNHLIIRESTAIVSSSLT